MARPDPAHGTTSPAAPLPRCDGRLQSVLIGLGPAGEALAATMRAHADPACEFTRLHCHAGRDPAIRAAWSGQPRPPGDVTVLAIDAGDTDALAAVPFWAECLSADSALSLALFVGQTRFGPEAPWRGIATAAEALAARCAGGIEVVAQPAPLRAAAAQALADGVLMLTPGLVGYDVRDVREMARLGRHLRTGATVWRLAERRAFAFGRLWDRLQPASARAVLAFLHAGQAVGIEDLDWLAGALHDRMPEDGQGVVSVFLHADWPPERRVLGLTLAV